MLMPNPSLKSVIFWQWANQSLNGASCFVPRILTLWASRPRTDIHTSAVAVNYSNANKSISMSTGEIACKW